MHAVKPETCVAGPVTFGINYKTGKIEWFLKMAEICAFAGELALDQERLRKHFNIARQQVLKLITGLDTESLRNILEIEEPQTFKIAEEPLPTKVAEKLRIE